MNNKAPFRSLALLQLISALVVASRVTPNIQAAEQGGPSGSPPYVFVVGEVKAPGRFPWTNGMRLTDAIQCASGCATNADMEHLKLTRWRGTNVTVCDYGAALASSTKNLTLGAGDRISVPRNNIHLFSMTNSAGKVARVASSGNFETKVTDEKGNVQQWYQHFRDSEGKEMLEITRKTPGPWKAPYESIQFVTTYSYNADGNVSEKFEFFGDGELRHHIIYKYDEQGNFLRGEVFDANGNPAGRELTKPAAHMYGKARRP